MAKVIEKEIVIKLSKLVKGDSNENLSILLEAASLEAVVEELVSDKSVIVEVTETGVDE